VHRTLETHSPDIAGGQGVGACLMYRILKFVMARLRVDSILLTEGSILRDLGLTWLVIIRRHPTDHLHHYCRVSNVKFAYSSSTFSQMD